MLNRRWGTGLHVAVAVFLAVALFGFVNFIGGRYYKRFDSTRSRIYSLSEKSRSILKGLSEPLVITVFYQPDHPLYDAITGLLKEYGSVSGNIRVEKVDPHKDIAKAQHLAGQYKVDALNVVVFDSAGRSKYVTDQEIADFDYTGYMQGVAPRLTAFKGEEAFTSAVLSVTQEHSPAVRFITGHGEKPMENTDLAGISQALKRLHQDNMNVASMALLGEEALSPDKVDCIVIAGPTRRFAESELNVLNGYLKQGGALLAFLDPLVESGVERIAADWGIEVGWDVVVDPAQKLPFVSAANVFITDYTGHAIVKDLAGVATLFPLLRSVGPASELPEGVEAVSLAHTSKEGWGETTLDNNQFTFEADTDRAGPVSIAAAAWSEKARLVVIGDSDFVTNAQIGNLGNTDLFLNSVNWLTRREKLISISPKMPEDMHLNLTNRQMTAAFWQVVAGLPMLSLVAGGVMWWRRRG